MSKFAIGTQAGHLGEGRRSAPAVAALRAINESSVYVVEADGHGTRLRFTGASLTFTLARRRRA
jgi:hypothetical protein